jgi:hypothetical protein
MMLLRSGMSVALRVLRPVPIACLLLLSGFPSGAQVVRQVTFTLVADADGDVHGEAPFVFVVGPVAVKVIRVPTAP